MSLEPMTSTEYQAMTPKQRRAYDNAVLRERRRQRDPARTKPLADVKNALKVQQEAESWLNIIGADPDADRHMTDLIAAVATRGPRP